MLAMVLGLVLTPIITLIAPAKDKERQESIFSCYNKKILVSSKQSIIEEEEEPAPVPVSAKTAKNTKSKNKNTKKRK